jgi:1-deoxy-D-xylulose-5-phosphate synthase
MSIACPSDERECRLLLSTAYAQNHPVAVRYPRGAGVGVAAGTDLDTVPLGKAELRREGTGLCILAFGTLLYPALEVAEKLNATVVNMRWAKPLDEAMILQMAAKHSCLVTLEDACVMGGAGSALGEFLQKSNLQVPLLSLGLPDQFIEHGDYNLLMTKCGLDVGGVSNSIKQRFPALLALNSAFVGK